jgi:hypothetical protein
LYIRSLAVGGEDVWKGQSSRANSHTLPPKAHKDESRLDIIEG